MKAIKAIMVGAVGLLVLLAGIGFTLPASVHIERSIVMSAKPEAVFPLLNDLHEFNRWSPWGNLDPKMVTTYSGPSAGVGAQMSWSGNARVGSGSQEITESVPNQRVRTRLQFGGYDHPSSATFTVTPEGEGSKVTWSYDTSMGYDIISRYFGMMLDHWIGADYERGLAALARLAQSPPAAAP